MKKKKLKKRKKASNNNTTLDHYELVFGYYPGTLRRRVTLRLKSSPTVLQDILDSLTNKN